MVGGARMALARWLSAVLTTLTGCELGWDPGGREHIGGGNISGLRSYKDTGIGWLGLEALSALEKDNERLRVINHQLKASCKVRSSPWQLKKRLLSLAS